MLSPYPTAMYERNDTCSNICNLMSYSSFFFSEACPGKFFYVKGVIILLAFEQGGSFLDHNVVIPHEFT